VKLQNLENKDYVKTLSDREHLTVDFVDSFVNTPFGRPLETYAVSKLAVIAYISALHNALVAQPGSGKKINVFSCCPGFIATDLNNNMGTKTVAEGADTPVWLALHSPQEGSGKFWAERKVLDF
jgi:carbonyl reductase 1